MICSQKCSNSTWQQWNYTKKIHFPPARVDVFLANKLTKLKCNTQKTQREWSHRIHVELTTNGVFLRTALYVLYKKFTVSDLYNMKHMLFLATQTESSTLACLYSFSTSLMHTWLISLFFLRDDVGRNLRSLSTHSTVAIVTRHFS